MMADRKRSGGVGTRRSARFGVEGLEPRNLLTTVAVAQYPVVLGGSPVYGGGGPATAIVTGPDQNLWFAGNQAGGGLGVTTFSGLVGKVDSGTGATTVYQVPSGLATNGGLTTGPDGNLWFSLVSRSTGPSVSRLGSINPSTGAIAEFPVPNAAAQIVSSGGLLWFTEPDAGKIASFNTTTHAVLEYALSSSLSGPTGITRGPDGNLWFTEANAGKVGSINPTSLVIAEYTTPTASSGPASIVVGPDGNLWFVEVSANQIGLINPTTHAINEFPAGLAGATLVGAIVAGPDGNLEYTGTTPRINSANVIGTINPSSHATSMSILPASRGGTLPITVGPDGNLWVYAQTYLQATGGNGSSSVKVRTLSTSEVAIQSNVFSDPLGRGNLQGGPLANATVYVDLNKNGKFDTGEPTTTSDLSGYYTFTGLLPGTLTVRPLISPGMLATGPAGAGQTVTLTGGNLATPSTFGIFQAGSVLPLTLNPTPFGTANPDLATAEVKGLYQVILGRAADPGGLQTWSSALKSGQTVAQVATTFLNSTEYLSKVVASYYAGYLGRAGTAPEIASWVSSIQAGRTEESVASLILESDEFNLAHPDNADFVQTLYADLLGRTPATSETSFWTNGLAAGASRVQVVSAIVGSTEAATRAVNGFYPLILQFQDPSGTPGWVKSLQSGASQAQVASAFFASPAFAARANATVV